MQKPNGYEEAQASGEFTPVNLGGHHAVIKQVTEKQSSTGKDMIVVVFDFATNDEQAGYFSDRFKNDTRDDKKWPFNGTKYIMVNDYQDANKTSRQFKTFCTCFEKSNGAEVNWGLTNWGAQFKGKKIGVVFGEEENEYDGQIRMRRLPKWFCRDDMVESAGVPEPKYLNGSAPATAPVTATNAQQDDGFMDISTAEEEIPF